MSALPRSSGPFARSAGKSQLVMQADDRQTPPRTMTKLASSESSPSLNLKDIGANYHATGMDMVLVAKEDKDNFSLLPGLPNELTFDRIITRVPWITLCSLSTVSRAWNAAIFKRKFYEARVRTNSTQTLVVIVHEAPPSDKISLLGEMNQERDTSARDHEEHNDDTELSYFPLAISLYDPGADAWRLLPPIAGMAEGIPHDCECVCSTGKVYILGGLGKTRLPMKEVYMLDLAAGHGKWLQCASMQRERVRFACHVKDGKIFAFGGTSSDQEILSDSEVFDIEQNIWSSVAPMLHRRTDHRVALSEGEFYVHGGLVCKESSSSDDSESEDSYEHPHLRDARFAEVFDSCTNQWRKLQDFKRGMQGPIMEVDGKLVNLSMSINHNSVEIYSGHSNSWISSQPISWKISEPGETNSKVSFRWPMYVLYQATGLDDEVLVWLFSVQYIEKWQRNYLLKSKGLGSKRCSLEWEKMSSASQFPEQILCMRRIQL